MIKRVVVHASGAVSQLSESLAEMLKACRRAKCIGSIIWCVGAVASLDAVITTLVVASVCIATTVVPIIWMEPASRQIERYA